MYPDLATLLAASTTEALANADPVDQQAFYDQAKRAVERFCGQSFTGETLTLTVDGNGGDRVSLPRRLATLTTLAVTGGGLDASDVLLSLDHDALTIKPGSLAGGNWVERALRSGPPIFPIGWGSVTITGLWGFSDAEMPNNAGTPVGIAMRLDMESQALAKAHGLAETVRAQSRLGLKTIIEGPLRTDLEVPDETLPLEAQQALEPYIWQPRAVVA